MEEVVRREYGSTLADLKINSKPHINSLTMLAEEYIANAPEVVRLIESRLQKALPQEKLPVMYLMDSIVKNVKKGPYQQLFAKNLTNIFCGVFAKVNEKTRAALFKLRSTWNQYFPSGILHALDVRVQQIDPAWPIMAPASTTAPPPASIHINPKFIKKPAPMESTSAPSTSEQPSTSVASSDLSDKERGEQEIRQSLIAKQQELLQIHQKRLELELEQTKARLQAQAMELKVKNQALAEQQVQLKQMSAQSQAPSTTPTIAQPAPALAPANLPPPQAAITAVVSAPANPAVVPINQEGAITQKSKNPVGVSGVGILGEAPKVPRPSPVVHRKQGLLGIAPGVKAPAVPLIVSAGGVGPKPGAVGGIAGGHSAPSGTSAKAQPDSAQSGIPKSSPLHIPLSDAGMTPAGPSRDPRRAAPTSRDPRLARDPRRRQAIQQQQQQHKQQQEQLLLLQQKKQRLQQQEELQLQQQQQEQQQLLANLVHQASLTQGTGLNAGSASGIPHGTSPGNASQEITSGLPSSAAPAIGALPVVPPAVIAAVADSVPTGQTSSKQLPRTGQARHANTTTTGTETTKKPITKGKAGSKMAKPGVKLDHLDLSGKGKPREGSPAEKDAKQEQPKKVKSLGDKAADQDASKRNVRSSSRNYRKTTKEDKGEKVRSESRISRHGASSESPSHSDSRSRSRSRSRSPRTGSTSPRSNERRERERRGGKSDSKRTEAKENKADAKTEKRKSQSPDGAEEEKTLPKKYSKQDQLPPKKRARLIEKEQQQEAEREREKERESRARRTRSERERAAGWVRSGTRDPAGLRPPYRRPSLQDPNIKIPQELSMNKLANVLEQAEKKLHSGDLTHDQHQQLLRELNEIYNIQRQKREEEKYRHPPPPHHGRRDIPPYDGRELRDPRDPRMMRDPYEHRDPRDPRPRDPRAFRDPHEPRDIRDPRSSYDTRVPPEFREGPDKQEPRGSHLRDFADDGPRGVQDPGSTIPQSDPRDPRQRSLLEDRRSTVPQSDPRDPRQRSLLEDPRMRKFPQRRAVEGPREGMGLHENPGIKSEHRLTADEPVRKPLLGDAPRKEVVNPEMDVDERKTGFQKHIGPLDEKLPIPPRDTDDRDLQQFAKQGDLDLRKMGPAGEVHVGSTKDVDYRMLPAAFQEDEKDSVQGVADTDERQHLKAGDGDELKTTDTSGSEKIVGEGGKVIKQEEERKVSDISVEIETKKESEPNLKPIIKKGAKAEWEAAARRGSVEKDVDMRQTPAVKEEKTAEDQKNADEQQLPGKDHIEEKSSESSLLGKGNNNSKDEGQKVGEDPHNKAEPKSDDTDERIFPEKPDEIQLKAEDVDLPSDDVDFRHPMPGYLEREVLERRDAPPIQPFMDFKPSARPKPLLDMEFHDQPKGYRGRPFFGPHPPDFRHGRDGPSNKWQTWKKEHPDEVCAPHFEEDVAGLDPRDPRHPRNMSRDRDPRRPFRDHLHHMDPHRRYRDMPPMGPPDFEEGDMPPIDHRFHRERRDLPDEEMECPRDGLPHMHRGEFREDDGPPPLERQEFRRDERPPMDPRDFPPNMDPRDFPPEMDPRDPRYEEFMEMRNAPGRMRRNPRSGNFEDFPPDLGPADTPQSPEPEDRMPPMYVVRPGDIRPRDGPEKGRPHPDMRPPYDAEESPDFRGPRPEGMPPHGPEGFHPREGPPFRGPRPEGMPPHGPGDRDHPRGPMRHGPRGPDGPRFVGGSNGTEGMPRYPINLQVQGGPRHMGSGDRSHPDEGMVRMPRPPGPEGPIHGPNSSQFGPRPQSPPVSSAMARNGPSGNLPPQILSNLGNFQQIVQNVSKQVLQNLRMNNPNQFQQQRLRQQIPAQNLIRSALQNMGLSGNIPSSVMQDAQQKLIQQMQSMPNINMNMLRMMRPQQPVIPNQRGMDRPPHPQGSIQQPTFEQQGGPPGPQQRMSFSPSGMPPNSMQPAVMPPNSVPPGMQQVPPHGVPEQGPPQNQGMSGQPGPPSQGLPPQPGMTQQGIPPPGMVQGGQQGPPLPGVMPGDTRIPQGMTPGMAPGPQGMQQRPMGMPQGGPAPGIMNVPTSMGPGFFQPGPAGPGIPSTSQLAGPAPATGGGVSSQFDINSLFSKLISSGIIKEPIKAASPHPDQTSTPPPVTEKAKEGETEGEKEEDKDSQEMEDDGVYDIPEITITGDELKTRFPGVIKRMYSGMQCTSCGQRFVIAQMDRYRKHLDWHFRQNRKKQDGIKATTSRKWYYEVDEWLEYEEINDMEDARSSFFDEQAQEFAERDRGNTSVPVTKDPNDEFCKICRESFEQFFDEEMEEWHLRDAIRVEEKTFHPTCYDDVKDTSGFLETPTDELQSPPFVRTRNISFSGVPVSPGASFSSDKPPLIASGKASWDAVKGTAEGAASGAGAPVKSEPGTVVGAVPAGGGAADDGSKAPGAVKVKMEPEEPMDTGPSVGSTDTQIKTEPLEQTDAVKVKTEFPQVVVKKEEPEVEGEVPQTVVEKEQIRKEEVRSSLEAFRAKSSPLPFLEEVSPEKSEEMDVSSAVAVSVTSQAELTVPESASASGMKMKSEEVKTVSLGTSKEKEVASHESGAAPTTAVTTSESPPSISPAVTSQTQVTEKADSAESEKALPQTLATEPSSATPAVTAEGAHATKKPPLREAVASLRELSQSSEPPVLEAVTPLPNTGQSQGQDTDQSPSRSIFDKLTPPPALISIDIDNSAPERPSEESSSAVPTTGNDANPPS